LCFKLDEGKRIVRREKPKEKEPRQSCEQKEDGTAEMGYSTKEKSIYHLAQMAPAGKYNEKKQKEG